MKLNKTYSLFKSTLISGALLMFGAQAQAAETLKICVWDIIGKSGPVADAMEEYKLEALKWGINVKLLTNSSERIVTEQFRSKVCDGALMTGWRARDFVPYTGSLFAVGAIPDNKHLKLVHRVLASPKSADKMENGQFVIGGIAPAGTMYIFVRDKGINSLARASGKKVAVLDYDEFLQKMVANLGATPVAVNPTNAGGKFNNGSIDVLPAPSIAYEAFELYKGMEPNGGVLRFPFAQLSLQLVLWKNRIPEGLAQKSRTYFFNNFDRTIAASDKAQKKIKPKYWVDLPKEDIAEYELLMSETRINAVKQGYWDKDMILLQRRVRCKFDKSRAECAKPKNTL